MENARQSSVEISKKTGLSRQTVNKTIDRLEKNNVIWGYHPTVNLDKIGKKRFIMLIKSNQTITKEDFIKSSELIENMLGKEQTGEIIYTGFFNGRFDWLVMLYADDVIHAKKILRDWKIFFDKFIDEIYLLEELFTTRENNIKNPEFLKVAESIL